MGIGMNAKSRKKREEERKKRRNEKWDLYGESRA
jgi:hypothetical protein